MSEEVKTIKLVAKEFEVHETSGVLPIGAKYSHFQDIETGKYYRPTEACQLMFKPEDFNKLFVELEE